MVFCFLWEQLLIIFMNFMPIILMGACLGARALAIPRPSCRTRVGPGKPCGELCSVQKADALERAGHSSSILQGNGNGGAWKTQRSIVQTAAAFSVAGVSPSALRGDAGYGSRVACDSFLQLANKKNLDRS
jgi:hypothetical protein